MTTLLFRGWVRKPGGRWTVAVQAGSERQCWRLLDEIKNEGKSIDKAVLPAGRTPSQRYGMGCPRDVPVTRQRLRRAAGGGGS